MIKTPTLSRWHKLLLFYHHGIYFLGSITFIALVTLSAGTFLANLLPSESRAALSDIVREKTISMVSPSHYADLVTVSHSRAGMQGCARTPLGLSSPMWLRWQ